MRQDAKDRQMGRSDKDKERKEAVVVAQLTEKSLPTPEFRGSNPDICKIYITYILSTVLKRRK